MAGMGNTYENGLLLLEFNNTNFATIGDATGLRGSSVAGNFYLALHTSDPGEGGSQTTNELSYPGYTRMAVPRSGVGFTVSGSAVTLAANVDFPQATAGGTYPTDVFFFSIGTESSGAGIVLYSGALGNAPVIMTAKTDDVITVPGETFSVDDRVQFFALEGAGLPTGITEGTVYFVKTVSGSDITVSTTSGGATLNITAAGAGFAQLVSKITINLNTIPRMTTGTTIRKG